MDMSAIDAMAAECMKDVNDVSDDDDGVDDADLLVMDHSFFKRNHNLVK